MRVLATVRSQIGCVAISTLACAALLFDAQSVTGSTDELKSQLEKLKKEQAVAATNKESDEQLAVSRSATANKLSQELEVVCANTGVNLKQVQFEQTIKPISEAGDGNPPNGWALNQATIILEGTAPQVFQALRQMGSGSTVFRMDDVSINRLVSSDGGVSGVSAELKAAVLVRTEDRS